LLLVSVRIRSFDFSQSKFNAAATARSDLVVGRSRKRLRRFVLAKT
jgi:hypothetical protein